MRGKSHAMLGQYLAKKYMSQVPRRCVRAFLIGCIEPDRNPITYLKGSLQFQWLRGHNYLNAKRYIERLAFRLEKKEKLFLLDYYAIGKLVHYTADAFTSAHNESFPTDLDSHREYEAHLQRYFIQFLATEPPAPVITMRPIMEMIREQHRAYYRIPANIATDTIFAYSSCCILLGILMAKPL